MPKLNSQGFTVIELLSVVVVISVISTLLYVTLNVPSILEKQRYAAAKESLINMSKAALVYANETGSYPPEVGSNIAPAFTAYMSPATFPEGAFPGSVYDWDNWENLTCWDGSTGNIQITLRDINDYKGELNYTIYYVIEGPGVPDCSEAAIRGECVNCESRYP